MVTLRNKRQLAVVKRTPKRSISGTTCWGTRMSRVNEDYNKQVSKEIPVKITKNLSHELSRTKNRTVGALWWPECFRLNSQVRVQSGTGPETPWSYDTQIQECSEDCSLNELSPEMGTSVNRSPHSVNLHPWPGTSHQSSFFIYAGS